MKVKEANANRLPPCSPEHTQLVSPCTFNRAGVAGKKEKKHTCYHCFSITERAQPKAYFLAREIASLQILHKV